jgi:hypothetical protein
MAIIHVAIKYPIVGVLSTAAVIASVSGYPVSDMVSKSVVAPVSHAIVSAENEIYTKYFSLPATVIPLKLQ